MGQLLELARFQIQVDLIKALETMLHDARRGDLLGLALVGMYAGRVYVVDIVGETKRSPTFTRGMLCLLDEELSAIISGK